MASNDHHVKGKKEEDEEDEEEEYTEEGEEEEEEEGGEEEPKLKYQRIGSNLSEILKTDAASCMAVHDKFLALGTHYGLVYVLDFHGDIIKRYAQHQATVNEICIDSTGEYIGSCGNDGKVYINGLYSSEMVEHSFKRPVTAIALDPDYYKKKTNQFACGGKAGQLILNSKGFLSGLLGSTKTQVLHSGEGPIHAIKWKGSLIAWANDTGVKIYDCHTNQRITYINRPKGSPRPDLYRCCLHWENESTLIIGWADSIKIGKVKERTNVPNGLANRFVEIVMDIQTEYKICGISPFGDFLIVLVYSDNDEASGRAASRPELRIITRGNEHEDVSSDVLTIHGYEEYKAIDYRLHQATAESLFYIVSPKDIIMAAPRDLDDRLNWLLDRKKFEEAIDAAERQENQLKQHTLTEIGERYITYLLESGNIQAAATMCSKILKQSAALWEKWIYQFWTRRQLKYISSSIPIGNPQLSETVYEMVLSYFLEHDSDEYLRLISEWPSTLYNIDHLIVATEDQVKKAPDAWILMDALAQLYTYAKRYDKTLATQLRLKRGKPFQLIRDHDLFDAIQDKVAQLMDVDMKEAVNLLVSNTDRISVQTVVAQLSDRSLYLHNYLHAIFTKDVQLGQMYHDQQVELYAQYDPKLLGTFLRASNSYPLEKALHICEKRNFYPEMVYLLGRMGNNKQALNLLIDKVKDVKQAIEFVQSQNDDELWESLIAHSMNDSKFVAGLLENIGAHVDPIKLIKRIPNGLSIDGLRNRLVKIISDYNLQTSLREGCNNILKSDCVDLMERYVHGLQLGQQVGSSNKCAICNGSIVPVQEPGGIFVFFCTHVYHNRCLRSSFQTPGAQIGLASQGSKLVAYEPDKDEQLWCTICNQKAEAPTAGRELGPR